MSANGYLDKCVLQTAGLCGSTVPERDWNCPNGFFRMVLLAHEKSIASGDVSAIERTRAYLIGAVDHILREERKATECEIDEREYRRGFHGGID